MSFLKRAGFLNVAGVSFALVNSACAAGDANLSAATGWFTASLYALLVAAMEMKGEQK